MHIPRQSTDRDDVADAAVAERQPAGPWLCEEMALRGCRGSTATALLQPLTERQRGWRAAGAHLPAARSPRDGRSHTKAVARLLRSWSLAFPPG